MIPMKASPEAADIRRALEYRLSEVELRIAALKKRSLPEVPLAGGDNTPLTETADVVQALDSRGVDDVELAQLLRHAELVEKALERAKSGSYGICERCKQRIDPARLRALPEAIHCVTCEERLERFS